jgi:hypothetical protein
MASLESRPPFPPFTVETANQKVKAAQDGWNTKNPDGVKMAYTPDSIWRNRDQFLQGRDEIKEFLSKKWEKENGYRLRKELFSFTDNKVCQDGEQLPPLIPHIARLKTPDCCPVLVRVLRREWAVVAHVWPGGLDICR